MKRRGSLCTLAMLAVATHARADVAPPAPRDIPCPAGAIGALPTIPSDALDGRGRPARPWPYCRPTTCSSDAECADGRVCSTAEVGLGVRDREDFGVTSREAIDRGCEPDGTCLNLQSACERARRCVMAPAPAPAPAPASSGLCQASPLARASLTPWMLAALGFMLFRARRPGARRRARLRSRESALRPRSAPDAQLSPGPPAESSTNG